MEKIELPAYSTIVPNEVFGKKAKDVNYPLIGKTPATNIIRITKFKVPNEQEVLDFIRENAKNYENFSSKKESRTNRHLKSLPPLEIKEIAKGNKDSLIHLREHYPELNLQEGRTYFYSSSGVVSVIFLDAAKELISEEGIQVDDNVIKRVGRNQIDLAIRLLENEQFPDILELEYLMSRGVKDSDVFSVKGNFKDYNTVANQIRMLHHSIGSKNLMHLIKDESSDILDQRASSIIRRVSNCLSEREAVHKVIGGLANIIEKTVQGENKKDFPYDENGFSLN